MAVSNQDIIDFLLANPGMSDADIGAAMAQYGVSPAQMAQATGLPLNEVNSRLSAVGMFSPEPTTNRVIPTARGTVIEGDNIDEQLAGIPQVVYETRVDPNNPAKWEVVSIKTGEVIDSGTFAGGGNRGLLAAAAPVIGLAASTVGLPGITGLLGNLTGATGSTLAGLTGATIGGGTTAIAGGTTEDILKGALLAGGASYGSSLLDNYLATGSIADPGITERQLAIADAKQLADQGLSQSQIADVLGSSGYNEVMVDSAIRAATKGLTPTTIPTSTATDVVNVTGTAAPAISTGGLLSSLVATPAATAVSAPAVTDAGTVKVTGTSTPQQVDQAVLNLVNSQLSSNVKTPANLANVQVTGTADKGMMSNADTTSAILNTLTGLPTTPATTTTTNNVANVEVTGQKPATTQELASAITSAIPSVTPTQAAAIAEQVITSGKPVTNQEVISAITAALPAVTTPTTVTTQPVVPEQTITAQKPTTINDVVTAAAIPLIQPSTPLEVTPVTSNKTNELGLTDAQMLNLLKGGIGLLGGLGGAAALTNTGGTGMNPAGLPTQLPPMYTGDYFTKVQQNYNQLLPAVPRDVASPLRDWYLSQYGA